MSDGEEEKSSDEEDRNFDSSSEEEEDTSTSTAFAHNLCTSSTMATSLTNAAASATAGTTTPSEFHLPKNEEQSHGHLHQKHRAHEGGRDWLHRSFQQVMCERFLRGEDKEFVDYEAIDNCEQYDDIMGVVSRDLEERYFDAGDVGNECFGGVSGGGGDGGGGGSGGGGVEEEDDYMKFDLSQLP